MKYEFKTEPYEHQLEAFNQLKDLPYFALFADMGTGKTKITLDIVGYRYCKGLLDCMLIIAPNNVHSQWVLEEIPKHLNVEHKCFIWNSTKVHGLVYGNALTEFITKKMDCLKILTVNVEAFQSGTIESFVANFVKTFNVNPFIVVDEATRIKSPKAKRSKLIHKLNKYGQRAILTGTPVTKSPFSLWSMFEFLKHDYFEMNSFKFENRYGILMTGVNERSGMRYKTLIDEKTWSIVLSSIKKYKADKEAEYALEHMESTEEYKYELTDYDYDMFAQSMSITERNVRYIERKEVYSKFKNLKQLKELIAPVTFSISKSQCLDLPPKIYEQIFVDMNKEQAKVYKDLKTKMIAEYDGMELTVQNKIALTTRLMQVCGGFFPLKEVYDHDLKCYVPYTDPMQLEVEDGQSVLTRAKGELIGKKNVKLEALKLDLEEVRFPVIIWGQFHAELEYLYKELKKVYNVALYYGKTSQSDREEILRAFKNNEYDIFLGNPATAAYGLNLQNATTQEFYSNGFRVEDRLQAEDRSHRIGVKSSCLYRDLICKGTIDEKVVLSIASGRSMNEFFKSHSLRDLLE